MTTKRKKKQHYVFKAYLKPWTEKRKIWCLRSGEVFPSSLERVACERFFYRSCPLTEEEQKFIDKVMIEEAPEPLKGVLQKFMGLYCFGQRIKENSKSPAWNPEHEQLIDVLIETGAEDWLSGVEEMFLPFLEQLRDGKAEFYKDYKSAGALLLGLCVQFTRTKQARETSLRVMGQEIRGRNTHHMMSALAFLVAIRLSYNLFSDRESFKVGIIENESDAPFITTDQPVINMHGDVKADGVPPDEFELFYPLSPKRAMVFLKKETSVQLEIGAIAANSYNVTMAQHSHEQIFSNSKEYLESFAKIIGGTGSGNRLRSW
jgi:hypothetical protein